jgi:hypothetical protein
MTLAIAIRFHPATPCIHDIVVSDDENIDNLLFDIHWDWPLIRSGSTAKAFPNCEDEIFFFLSA